jgi:hypothetical protein
MPPEFAMEAEGSPLPAGIVLLTMSFAVGA